ncbi:MAG: bifunctional hydroxymethylpyrimidine kinase/phosphomethylpyrimidine kinase [Planctomycetota bacterium]|jgi:hydroxymethylpyrimidine/phosphomethylpyrimidine kinase
MKTALTIAGSDPSGGAGIQGDLKTFAAHGVYGMAVITALTAQNTVGVRGAHDVPPDFVRAQLDAVLDDLPVGAAKTGMLSVPATIEAVASVLADRGLPFLVVDPVMVATIRTVGQMREAAEALVRRGARGVLITGGHLAGDRVVDLLHAGGAFREYAAARLDTPHTHGTGCALAAAIAAHLARGVALPDAVARARAFVRRGIERAVVLGSGHNPLNHFAAVDE